ncbi:hypothetical protein FNH08_45205 [Streptomyces spongiae]|uniref:Alpha/beta hydrolase n=1 Tax=Streptomyces spongiae TaxID=565072 RepID=A0A5N8XXW7_9ACTN|nr:hypothetical protein [Streptomyces spongiae]
MVVVHGIGKQYLGTHSLHGDVAPALLDGVRLAGGPSLKPSYIEVAFYGHWFRPPGSAAAKGEPAYGHRDVTDPFEAELLLALWQEAARLEPDRVPAPDSAAKSRSKAAVPYTVQRALYALSRSSFLAGVADRFLIGVLKQVRRYLTDDGVRDRVQQEIAACVAPDTRVLVGHSLGSVVAYEALCAHPEWPVTTLVTIGSPLGTPHLVFDRLRPAPRAGTGRWPGAVRRWSNLCDRRDVVALAKELAPLFPDADRSVTDVLVDNGWRAHAIERHLTAAETGAAIAEGLAGEPL